jgi:hypothetical protein
MKCSSKEYYWARKNGKNKPVIEVKEIKKPEISQQEIDNILKEVKQRLAD